MKNYQFHPIANIFPLADGPELDALAEDIKKVGQQQPIVLYEDKILDGRRRYLACKKAGVTPKFLGLPNDKSPLDFVVSANLHRRNLSASQRAIVGLKMLPLSEMEAKKRQRLSKGRGKKGAHQCAIFTGKASEQVAQIVGCSARMIEMVKRVEALAPELLSRIDGKDLDVTSAYRMAREKDIAEDDRNAKTKKRTRLRIATIPNGFQPIVKFLQGDAVEQLRQLPERSAHCCVTSVPYYLLRDYGHDGQIGLEDTVEEWVSNLVNVFQQVHRVLRDDGTCWVNVGDTYAHSTDPFKNRNQKRTWTTRIGAARRTAQKTRNVHPKSLLFAPHRLAIALAEDGWIARSEIIVERNNTDGCKNRPVRTHDDIFLLAKTEEYYYDADYLREGYSPVTIKRRCTTTPRRPKSTDGNRTYELNPSDKLGTSIWKINVASATGAGSHPAPMPVSLATKCVVAGCPEGGTVLDPFVGSGTTAVAAVENRRHCIGIDLSAKYLRIARKRVPGARILKKAG